jgi:hypothetical protein
MCNLPGNLRDIGMNNLSGRTELLYYLLVLIFISEINIIEIYKLFFLSFFFILGFTVQTM